jgi:hypothetical protein
MKSLFKRDFRFRKYTNTAKKAHTALETREIKGKTFMWLPTTHQRLVFGQLRFAGLSAPSKDAGL